MSLLRCIDPEQIIPISRSTTAVFKTGTWGGHFPEYGEKLSTCRGACPAGEDIPAYIALARENDLEAAFLKIARENPLASVCGRVCYHPCEHGCLRTDAGEAVPIHRVERFVGDYGLKNLAFTPPEKLSGVSAAVVGSGPAGLSCAYHLRKLGHEVTIFEAEDVLGGMMRLGIPAYRLPRSVVDRSIEMILAMGIKTRTGFRLGNDDSWKELDRFEAVFLGIGAHNPVIPEIKGRDRSEVVSGLEYLKQINSGKITKVAGPVVVMGGGNTAIDAARVSRRLGADVTILYRRSRQEMPASAEEIADAISEGVALRECVLPVAVESSDGEGLIIKCVKTEPRGSDPSGRTRYEPVEGSEVDAIAATFVIAAGQSVEIIKGNDRVSIGPDTLSVSPYLRVADGKYFAGGDVVAGPRRICDAIGGGKLAALSMHSLLSGLDMESVWPRVNIGMGGAFSMEEYLYGKETASPRIRKPVTESHIKPEWIARSPGKEPPRLQASEAVRGFDEVVGDVDMEELLASCRQCISCGTCIGCDRCYIFCPEMAVRPPEQPGGAYSGDREYCKGCGVCAAVCPRGVITMDDEQ